MRKLLTLAASSAALIGVAGAVPLTFTGTLDQVATAENQPTGATDPVGMSGESFTITLDYDEASDSFTSAMIMIGDATDDAEIIRASIIDVNSATANPNALDELEIDLVSTNGALPGNFDLDFEFFNTAFMDDSLRGAITALTDQNLGALVCSHIMFNFGGFKYEGTLSEGGITFNPVDPIPVPGAAVLMLSGLAAAGVARRRRA